MCYKYCVRIRPDRHSDCFASQGANYYRYAKFDENYCCMVCLRAEPTLPKLITHMTDSHHPFDLKFFGYNLHILKRVDQ